MILSNLMVCLYDWIFLLLHSLPSSSPLGQSLTLLQTLSLWMHSPVLHSKYPRCFKHNWLFDSISQSVSSDLSSQSITPSHFHLRGMHCWLRHLKPGQFSIIVQLDSSDPLSQSLFPSHFHLSGMHESWVESLQWW